MIWSLPWRLCFRLQLSGYVLEEEFSSLFWGQDIIYYSENYRQTYN